MYGVAPGPDGSKDVAVEELKGTSEASAIVVVPVEKASSTPHARRTLWLPSVSRPFTNDPATVARRCPDCASTGYMNDAATDCAGTSVPVSTLTTTPSKIAASRMSLTCCGPPVAVFGFPGAGVQSSIFDAIATYGPWWSRACASGPSADSDHTCPDDDAVSPGSSRRPSHRTPPWRPSVNTRRANCPSSSENTSSGRFSSTVADANPPGIAVRYDAAPHSAVMLRDITRLTRVTDTGTGSISRPSRRATWPASR